MKGVKLCDKLLALHFQLSGSYVGQKVTVWLAVWGEVFGIEFAGRTCISLGPKHIAMCRGLAMSLFCNCVRESVCECECECVVCVCVCVFGYTYTHTLCAFACERESVYVGVCGCVRALTQRLRVPRCLRCCLLDIREIVRGCFLGGCAHVHTRCAHVHTQLVTLRVPRCLRRCLLDIRVRPCCRTSLCSCVCVLCECVSVCVLNIPRCSRVCVCVCVCVRVRVLPFLPVLVHVCVHEREKCVCECMRPLPCLAIPSVSRSLSTQSRCVCLYGFSVFLRGYACVRPLALLRRPSPPFPFLNVFSSILSSIDMYNNDVGQESAQKFMKQTGDLKAATLYFAS
jgi:hypothetical protein